MFLLESEERWGFTLRCACNFIMNDAMKTTVCWWLWPYANCSTFARNDTGRGNNGARQLDWFVPLALASTVLSTFWNWLQLREGISCLLLVFVGINGDHYRDTHIYVWVENSSTFTTKQNWRLNLTLLVAIKGENQQKPTLLHYNSNHNLSLDGTCGKMSLAGFSATTTRGIPIPKVTLKMSTLPF